MNDIKSILSVIKILERTIGILENCNDIGEIPDITRKRIIEMLNKATLEIYFLNSDSSDEKISESVKTPEKEQTIEASVISNVIEKTVSEITNETQQPVVEPVKEKFEENNIPETVADEVPVYNIPEKELITGEETSAEENIIEEENVIEAVIEENTVSEDAIFNLPNIVSDKPLFEWETEKSEPVLETQEANEEDNEINILKLQLEEERKRLEQELQNWQDEKRKRDEEILAAKRLLENLQQQAAINQTKQQSVIQHPVQPSQPAPQQQFTSRPSQPAPQQQVTSRPSQPAPQQQFTSRQSQPAPQQQFTSPQSQPGRSNERVQQPQQSAKIEPLIRTGFTKEPAKKEETQETLIDRFIGTKKVLYENFESDNMVNQISTPVSSLPKAIGINDRFRFIKELFGGDSDLYNETIKMLDTTGSLVSAISYIESNFSWDKNSDSVKQLISLIRRRYM
ncbi:MAG: hypothetical protein LBK97_04415 [Prevotellaceae bacterium]|jgi:hypothetical protein|nr:hypothetical protein [Prevotellaceae bacterium]